MRGKEGRRQGALLAQALLLLNLAGLWVPPSPVAHQVCSWEAPEEMAPALDYLEWAQNPR